MATRKTMHRKLMTSARSVVTLARREHPVRLDPVSRALARAAFDDEPTTDDDRRAIEEARADDSPRLSLAEVRRRLDARRRERQTKHV